MHKRWFAKAKWFGWYPATWQGWLFFLIYVAFVVWDFIRIDRHSHSVSDTLIGFVPEFLVATVFLAFLCYFTGEKPNI